MCICMWVVPQYCIKGEWMLMGYSNIDRVIVYVYVGVYVCMYVCMVNTSHIAEYDQPGKVAPILLVVS